MDIFAMSWWFWVIWPSIAGILAGDTIYGWFNLGWPEAIYPPLLLLGWAIFGGVLGMVQPMWACIAGIYAIVSLLALSLPCPD